MKRAAHLTSSLLARKGFAAPSQSSMGDSMAYAMGLGASATKSPVPAPAAESKPGLVASRLAALQDRTAPKVPCGKALRPACGGGDSDGKRVAMTLRLDHNRHLKLRVLSAHVNMSSQEILTVALDEYLGRHMDEPELRHCECLHGEAETPPAS